MAEPKRSKAAKKEAKKQADKGYVFPGEGSLDAEEVIDKFQQDAASLSYDPHFLCEKFLLFGEMLTGIRLYDYQEPLAYRIFYAITTFEAGSITYLTARQAGKTEVISFAAGTLMILTPALAPMFDELEEFNMGFKAGVFAPQSWQVEMLYKRIKSRVGSDRAASILKDPDINTDFTSFANLEMTNGSVCSSQTASKTSKIEGNSLHLAIIDESQDVDDVVDEKSIVPMTTALGGTVVRTGTTGTTKSVFYSEIKANKKQSRKIKDNRLRTHLEYDWKAIVASKRRRFDEDKKRFHLNYEKVVLNYKKRKGENSDAFKLSYGLVWSLESGMFMTEDSFDAICNKRRAYAEPKKLAQYLDDGGFIAMGIDWAKENADTFITIGVSNQLLNAVEMGEADGEDEEDYDVVYFKRVLRFIKLEGTDYELQHQLILDLIDEWNVSVVVADATGVGNAPTERLGYHAPENVSIIPFVFSRPAKSDMWQTVEADMKGKRLEFPGHKNLEDDDTFAEVREQCTNALRYYAGSYLVVHKSSGFKDDAVDSIGMFCLAAQQDVFSDDNSIEVSNNGLFNHIAHVKNLMNNSTW